MGTERSLQLQTFKMTGDGLSLTCDYMRFIRLPQNSPLRPLVLEVLEYDTDINSILRRIPSKLETFHISVGDWNYDEVRAGLAMQSGLKEVIIYTEAALVGEEKEEDREVMEGCKDERGVADSEDVFS
ncbi:hypothetical protein HDV00_002961 [Rhizophlyctis rosea]|nr:hypothetical protein HDV00_002961 [Rhizophlyctis rosea]